MNNVKQDQRATEFHLSQQDDEKIRWAISARQANKYYIAIAKIDRNGTYNNLHQVFSFTIHNSTVSK